MIISLRRWSLSRINDVYENQGTKFRILSESTRLYLDKYRIRGCFTWVHWVFWLSKECLLVDDPFKDLASVIEESKSKNAIKRDENFQLIQPIVTHAEFLNPNIRGNLINTILRNHKVQPNKQFIGYFVDIGNEDRYQMLYFLPTPVNV